jgi:hypothetical protein
MIARALDSDEYVIISSLDLSSALSYGHQTTNTMIGLPANVAELIRGWLVDIFYYVNIDGDRSVLFDPLIGLHS